MGPKLHIKFWHNASSRFTDMEKERTGAREHALIFLPHTLLFVKRVATRSLSTPGVSSRSIGPFPASNPDGATRTCPFAARARMCAGVFSPPVSAYVKHFYQPLTVPHFCHFNFTSLPCILLSGINLRPAGAHICPPPRRIF